MNDSTAFPASHPVACQGMTKREWLAAQAMIGILANPATLNPVPSEIAEAAVAHADAVLSQVGTGGQQ